MSIWFYENINVAENVRAAVREVISGMARHKMSCYHAGNRPIGMECLEEDKVLREEIEMWSKGMDCCFEFLTSPTMSGLCTLADGLVDLELEDCMEGIFDALPYGRVKIMKKEIDDWCQFRDARKPPAKRPFEEEDGEEEGEDDTRKPRKRKLEEEEEDVGEKTEC